MLGYSSYKINARAPGAGDYTRSCVFEKRGRSKLYFGKRAHGWVRAMNQSLEFALFNGGITDNFIDCAPNQFQLANNFVITKRAKLGVRPGSRRDDETASQVPGDPKRIGALIPFREKLFKQRADSLHYIDAGAMQTLTGPTGNPALPGGDETKFAAFSFWNGHFFITNDALTIKPQKVYKNGAGAYQVNTAGMPPLPSSPTVLIAGSGNSYLYRFLFKVSYVREGNLTFEVRGPTIEVSEEAGGGPSPATPGFITNIPSLDNGIVDNYDTASVVVEIYRTIANGNQFYFVDDVPNGTTSYNDETTDADLEESTFLYTEGGVAENDPPPVSKFLHITERAAYYAFISEGGESLENEIRQSKPGQPEAVPANFSVQVEDEIVGISSVRNIPIVLGKNSVYRLDGIIDEFGQGAIIPVKIASVGGLNHLGVVQTLDAVFFAGSDGFYETDGYQVIKLSNEFNTTYRNYTALPAQYGKIAGCYDIKERRLLWATQSPDAADMDFLFVCDLDQPRLQDGGRPFTNWHGKRLDENFEDLVTAWTATALAFFESKVYRATLDGYTFMHDDVYLNDERDTGTEWIKQPIQYDYKGPYTSYGAAQLRKWAPNFTLCAEPTSNVSCLPQFDNDFARDYQDCKEIRVKPLSEWGDHTWGDTELYGATGKLINQKRDFLAGYLRCYFKQLRLRNAFSSITASDYRGAAEVTGTTVKTVTLAGVEVFPADPIDYYMELTASAGGYTVPLLITGQPAANQVTVADPDNLALAGSDLKWQMKGFAKPDTLTIVSYALFFKMLTASQKAFTGDAAANE